MAIGSFFKGLFGGQPPARISDDPFGSRPAPKPSVTAEALPVEPRCIVQRDEMLDANSRIAGYRFVVRRLGSTLSPTVAEAAAALRSENVAAFAQRRLALLPVGIKDSYRAELRQFMAPNAYFLVASPSDGDWTEWQQAVAALKAAGGKLAVDDVAAAEKTALEQADLCVLDFRACALEHFERLVLRLTRGDDAVPVAVDGLSAWAEHRLCIDHRASYSLGGFAALPDEEEAKDRLNQSRLVLIEMLNLLRRDADLAEIAEVAKRDPAVTVKVVTMANAPIMGLSSAVASLDQAMMVLGRATLYRWLSVSMFRVGSGGGRDESLLEMALWRARFLELLAAGVRSKAECDEVFLVGLFSLLDSLLGIPMAQVLQRMALPPAVAEVLLDSGGPHGRYLLLAMAVEKGRFEQAMRMAAALSLDAEKLEHACREARAWAESALIAG